MKRILLPIIASMAIAFNTHAQILVAHYDFNGNTNDVSGNLLNGTPNFTPTYIAGAPATGGSPAIQLANGNYVAVPFDPHLNLTTWTVTAIVNLTGYNGSDSRIMERFDGSRWGSDFMSTEIYGTKYYGYAAGTAMGGPSSVIGLNQWVCLTSTYDGATLKTYMGGTLIYSVAWASSYNFTSKYPIMYIGSKDFNYGMIGAIDDIQIYSGALSSTQISGSACTNVPAPVAPWLTNGNAIAGNNTFGTLTNDDIVIKTNATQRGIITKAGLFGIGTGTAAPTATLHVNAASNGIRFQNLPASTPAYTQSVVADGSGNLALAPYGVGSSYTASQGITLSGTDFQLGNACGGPGNPFLVDREILFSGHNLLLNTSEFGKVYIGPGSCPGLTSRLELSSTFLPGAANSYALGAPSLSGLRFTNLTNATPAIPNTGQGVLSLDAEGDVIWVQDQVGTGGGTGTDWALGGNSIASNPSTYIGTNDTFDFNIYTSGIKRGRVTKDGNLDFGTNTITGTNIASSAMGTNNTILNAGNSFCAGKNNAIRNNFYIYKPGNAASCSILGAGNSIDSSDESSVLGEDNVAHNTHGSFIGGGHNEIKNSTARSSNKTTLYQGIVGCANSINDANYSAFNYEQHAFIFGSRDTIQQGRYVNIVGNRSKVNASNTVVLGSLITNTADNSIVAGVNGIRTATITDRGMGVMVSNATNYVPNHNLEVDAQIPGGGAGTSNIAFFNLPGASDLPAVLVDPTTGELFMSKEHYNIMGTGAGNGTVITDHQIAEHPESFSNALDLVGQINPKLYQNNGTLYPSLKLADNKPTYGIIAQDIQKVLPDLVTDIPSGKDKETVKGVNYNELIPILVQAVKDQQQQIKDLTEKLNKTAAQQDQTEAAANHLNIILSNKDIAVLDQNYPNPFDKFTTIGYYIPENVRTAIIQFSTLDGKVVKATELPSRGKGLINVYTPELTTGTYTYTLMADGKVIDTKKMQIIR